MNAIFEFFFCPVHGILAPVNWPLLAMFVNEAKTWLTYLGSILMRYSTN